MRSSVKITLIEPHEMVCNLLVPKTLIVAPRQSGKTTAVKEAIKTLNYYKVFVKDKPTIDLQFTGIKNIHVGKDYNVVDIDTIAYKIFIDDIDCIGADTKTGVEYIPLDSPGIYAATASTLNFDAIQHLIAIRRFDFNRICIVDSL